MNKYNLQFETFILLEYLFEKEILDEQNFYKYVQNYDINRLEKSLCRNIFEEESVNVEMHAGGIQATRELIKMAKPYSKKKVLDAGAGYGSTARILSKEFGCNVVALEKDRVKLLKGIIRNKCENITNIEYIKADAYKMPFMDRNFDMIFRQNAIYGQSETLFLDECYRILKNNGKIAFQGVFLKKRIPGMKCENLCDDYINILKDHGFVDIDIVFDENNERLKESFAARGEKIFQRALSLDLLIGYMLVARKE